MKRVLVIGDIMLDRYLDSEPVRISEEAPVLIVKKTELTNILGGAGNTAVNLKAMGFDVILQGIVGQDWAGEEIISLLLDKQIFPVPTIIGETTIKLRILCKGKQVIRIDSEKESEPINPLLDENVDIIVVSDYAKGAIGEDTIKTLKDNYDVAIIVNGKPKNIRYYIGADILVLNKKEADEVMSHLDKTFGECSYSEIAEYYELLFLVVTKGNEGIDAYTKDGLAYTIEALQVDVKDITGAGDTVTAALAVEIVKSGDMNLAIQLANKAGAIKVTKDKTAEVSARELDINPDDEGRPSTEQQITDLNSERLDG